ncbi:MAG: hypothetical protein WCT07_00180 [Candidatus Paceibacterota bacterium]|jgi:hypothetical protein
MLHVRDTQTELFFDLIRDGEKRAKTFLPESLESYMVFMLQRHLKNATITTTVFAIEYLENLTKNLHERQSCLSETADAGLILAGLFPERSRRLNVSYTYFTDMSQLCFFDLAQVCHRLEHEGEAMLYKELGENVQKLAGVLYASRGSDETKNLLDFQKISTLH